MAQTSKILFVGIVIGLISFSFLEVSEGGYSPRIRREQNNNEGQGWTCGWNPPPPPPPPKQSKGWESPPPKGWEENSNSNSHNEGYIITKFTFQLDY